MNTISVSELDPLGCEETVLVCSKEGKYQGLSLWFDVEFPDGSVLSTDPREEPTHWKQTVIVLPTSIEVSEKEPVAFDLKLHRNSTNPRRYNVVYTMLDALEVTHDISPTIY